VSFKDGKFGLLTTRREIAPDIFECDCECGNLLDVWRSQLTSGVQRDCGMCRRMVTYKSHRNGKVYVVRRIKPTSVHGHTRAITRTKNGVRVQRFFFTREFASWSMAIQRCHDKKFMFYDRYGGAGIRVCRRWREPRGQGLLNFLNDMGPRPLGKTLDRINPRGHYEPGNCRWATAKVQCENQTHKIWQHCAPPPVEKVRRMEARIAAEYEDRTPY
jgi:hypothetical protein